LALRAFLDEYYAERNAAHRAAMLTERPRGLGTYYDAFLGALAEHLAWLYDLPAPTWSRGYGYGLTRPHFGGTERGKAYLLACGLPAFRERMIFLEAEALHRIGAPYPPACRSPRP